MIAVLDYQITYLLAFLRLALRNDTVLQGWLTATADQICRGTYRVQPVYEAEGKVFVDATQLPCLAIVIKSAEPSKVLVDGSQDEALELWYAFDTPIDDVTSGGVLVSGPEKAEVWKRCVWDRICFWLRAETVTVGTGLSAQTINYMTDGKINSLSVGRCEFFPAGHTFGGLKATLTMGRTMAPMAVTAPKLLELLSIDIGSGANLTGAAVTGPNDEAEVDTSGD